MGNDVRKGTEKGTRCDSVEGGYTIFLGEETIGSFMESGDFSSARQLDHFKEIGAQIEKRLQEGTGSSLLALSATEKRSPRDFTVLQLAHLLAKHGRRVLIVDCDFLEPGLGGLIEDPDDLGFLDLLLYGSSLKSVSRSIGIDGVNITGPGSFPVSKTMPFAQGEFRKVRDFLRERSDVVIYCSTLYTEDQGVNPLRKLVDGIVLCCRIEEMDEGQLQKCLSDLGSNVPPVDLVCYCAAKELVSVAQGEPPAEGEAAGEEVTGPAKEQPEAGEREPEPSYLEKTEELEEEGERRSNLPRLIMIVVAVIIIVFITWWVFISRSIRKEETSQQMTELVHKQRDVREAAERTTADEEAAGGVVTGEPSEIQDEGEETVPPGTGEDEPVREEGGSRGPESIQEKPREAVAVDVPGGPRYTIHVASFRNVNRAGIEAEYLKEREFESRVVEFEVKGQLWYRVFVGNYASESEASKVRLELLTLKRISYARVIELKGE
ncbi:MAG: SPOR domain-containing protein [bacterium]|nr:MAG: SPOR domain-containing protein [bacterium]